VDLIVSCRVGMTWQDSLHCSFLLWPCLILTVASSDGDVQLFHTADVTLCQDGGNDGPRRDLSCD
jgi:hypothetical protein